MAIDKFEQSLTTAFVELGFNSKALFQNWQTHIGNHAFQMMYGEDLANPSISANKAFYVLTITRPTGDKDPKIDMIYAVLSDGAVKSHLSPVAEKIYRSSDGPLPDKKQVLADIAEVLRIQSIQKTFNLNENDTPESKLRKRKGL
jgi:hypothetical protein